MLHPEIAETVDIFLLMIYLSADLDDASILLISINPTDNAEGDSLGALPVTHYRGIGCYPLVR